MELIFSPDMEKFGPLPPPLRSLLVQILRQLTQEMLPTSSKLLQRMIQNRRINSYEKSAH
jgi:hypothetical protein